MNDTRAMFAEMGFEIREDRLPEAVVYSLARTVSLLERALAAVYKPFGLTPASFNLLMLLKHGQDPDAFTQHEVAQRLVASASDMSGLVDRVERKGLAKRLPGKDRRSHRLQITPKGAALLDEVWPHHLKAATRFARVLATRQATALVRACHQLRQGAA